MSKARWAPIRFIVGVVFVCGLVVAWCAQLGEGVQISAAASIRKAADEPDQDHVKERVLDAVTALEGNARIWKVTLLLGVGIVGASAVFFWILPRTRPGEP